MKDKTLKIKITFGVLLVFLGIIIISWNYLLEKRNQVYDTMYYEIASLPSYIEDQEEYEKEKVEEQIKEIIDDKNIEDNKDTTNKDTVTDTSKDDYLGRLMIPKINFSIVFLKTYIN